MAGRKKAVKIAYAATFAAKGLGFVTQLALIPVAALLLGQEGLGYLFSFAAILSFLMIGVAGFGPTASYLMANAAGDRNQAALGDAFWFLLALGLASGVLLALFLPVFASFADPGAGMVGLSENAFANISSAASFFLFLAYSSSTIDGARAAMRESHRSNFFAMFGSIVTLALTFWMLRSGGDMLTVFIVVYTVPVAAQFMNLLHFIIQHRRRIGRPRWNKTTARDGIKMVFGNVEAQSGMVLYLHGGTYLIGQIIGLPAAAILGAFSRVAIQVHSFAVALFNPVLAMISEGRATGESAWVKSAILKLGFMAFMLVGGMSIIIAFKGQWLSGVLIGKSHDSGWLFYPVLGLYLFAYSLTHLLYLTRLSADKKYARGTRILIAALLGIGVCLLPLGQGMIGFIGALAAPMLLLATIPYLRDVTRLLLPRSVKGVYIKGGGQ